jgi:hypothetical protein
MACNRPRAKIRMATPAGNANTRTGNIEVTSLELSIIPFFG